jgi:hypothetical protein
MMIELDSVDRMLERARSELSPSGADKARARASLGAVGAPSNASRAGARLLGGRFWQRLRAAGWSGVAVGVVLASLSFGAGYGLRSLEPRAGAEGQARVEAPRAPSSPRPVRERDGVSEPRAASEALPTPPAADDRAVLDEARPPAAAAPRKQRQARPRTQAATPAPSAAGDELALLRRVQRALRGSDPALALALLGELDERFPDTTLVEERQAAAVMAHCGLADPGARRRAEGFLEGRPGSVYAERVRAACGVERTDAPRAGEGSALPGHQ